MINSKHVNELADKIKAEIQVSNKDLLTKFPTQEYINHIKTYAQLTGYRYVSLEIEDFCNGIIENSNEQILELYQKLILINFILESKNTLDSTKLPEDIKRLYGTNFKRILKNIESDSMPPGFYRYPNDKFCKDLGVCSLRMIPVGAYKIELSGIQKRILFKRGWGQFFRGMLFITSELGGFKPLYEMHYDSHDPDLLAELNFEGRRLSYMRIAELLKMEKKIKGVFGVGWLLDPQLEKISPHLNHVRELPLKNGGKLFYVGSSAQVVTDATLKSATRKRLYNEGKYIPTNYMSVWSRKKLIEWGNKQHRY
jgi:hypothetical protein